MAQCCSKPQLQGHLKTQEFPYEIFQLSFFFFHHKTNENQLKQRNTLNQQQRAQISYPQSVLQPFSTRGPWDVANPN